MSIENDSQAETPETTPLLASGTIKKTTAPFSVLYRLLLCGFMVSLSFSVTQVPLVYVFRLMTCEAYYDDHPEHVGGGERCSVREIEAATARAVSLLGTSTTFFGVINLFIAGWNIKRFGVKTALAMQVFFPAVRLAVQNLGVMTGGSDGIKIIQWSQIINILGGPAGYVLCLNTFVAEVVEPKERTGALGRLQGCAMLGISTGFLIGGLVSDGFNILAPFQMTLTLFLISWIYVIVSLPWAAPINDVAGPASKGAMRFFGPLKTFEPSKWKKRDGRVQRHWGVLLLGIGVFLGVLATGYIPTLLQLYSTDVLGFGTKENGFLISLNSAIRGIFLTLAFPKIISAGRNWVTSRDLTATSTQRKDAAIPDLPTSSGDFAAQDGEPIEPPKLEDEKETFLFDLQFTRYSLLVDGILTGAATFVTKGWQMYVIAVVIPLASGTGSSAKGTILQMCPASERADALQAITLVEMIARLSTTTVFGLIFAAFAEIGQTNLVFTCNAVSCDSDTLGSTN
ncbi:major facilitator superfamily domain-containing protein [Calycina marina]|uniref:Major facilitator superfamily domain-containing protein n=1 Tax=Calycina marina TaxID=1763456 RepID=A0A9P7ZBN1_9HELO|nr:major facilitator superfamily domain-containing protein [Calycina marina]